MSKDKKKKKKKGKKNDGSAQTVGKATKSLKALADNPIVADVVAAALVSMAAALKDSKKARELAGQAGDQLGEMAEESSDRGAAMWQLALDIGRRTLESLANEAGAPKKKR
jgi:hypothetical protein